MQPLAIQLRGSQHHQQVLRLLIARFPGRLRECSVGGLTYYIGASMSSYDRCTWRSLAPLVGWRPILHWIGSDVLYWKRGLVTTAADPRERVSLTLRRNVIRCAIHFAGAPWLAKEMEALGLSATFVPVPALLPEWNPPPLPERPAFLCYLPEGRESFYGWPLLEQAARRLPSVHFLIIKHKPIADAPANIEFIGSVPFADMAAVYARATGIIRLPEHDGMAMTVLEALAYGRHVIWNYPFGACRLCARNSDALVQQIEGCAAGGQINHDARNVLEDWRGERVLDCLASALEQVPHLPPPRQPWPNRLQSLLRDLVP